MDDHEILSWSRIASAAKRFVAAMAGVEQVVMLVHHDQHTERWRDHSARGKISYAVGCGNRNQFCETGRTGAVYPLVTRL
jgi:hypothetical protein